MFEELYDLVSLPIGFQWQLVDCCLRDKFKITNSVSRNSECKNTHLYTWQDTILYPKVGMNPFAH